MQPKESLSGPAGEQTISQTALPPWARSLARGIGEAAAYAEFGLAEAVKLGEMAGLFSARTIVISDRFTPKQDLVISDAVRRLLKSLDEKGQELAGAAGTRLVIVKFDELQNPNWKEAYTPALEDRPQDLIVVINTTPTDTKEEEKRLVEAYRQGAFRILKFEQYAQLMAEQLEQVLSSVIKPRLAVSPAFGDEPLKATLDEAVQQVLFRLRGQNLEFRQGGRIILVPADTIAGDWKRQYDPPITEDDIVIAIISPNTVLSDEQVTQLMRQLSKEGVSCHIIPKCTVPEIVEQLWDELSHRYFGRRRA